MLVNPAVSAFAAPPTPAPAVQAALSPAALAAQTGLAQAPTQTAQAATAPPRGENAQAGQSRTQHGRRFDTLANSIDAQTDRRAARGSLLDIRA